MDAGSKRKGLAERIAEEHAAIRGALEEIRAEVDRLRAEAGPEHGAGRLPALLRDFDQHLRRHFELEEEGGFFGEWTGLDPGKHRRVERLLAQHRSLERGVSALVDGASRAEARRAPLSEAFVSGLRKLLADLLRHEKAENELAQELALQDTGGGD